MVQVVIRIEATSDDIYFRYHGLAIDKDLPENFWTADPSTIVSTQTPPLEFEKSFDLDAGDHRLTYGNSGYAKLPTVPYPWHTKIFVDGKQVGEGDVGRDQYLTVDFTVGGAPPVAFDLTAIALAAGAIIVTVVAVYLVTRR